MDKNYFLKLLRKQLEGTSTSEEDLMLSKYYELFESEPQVREIKNNESKQQLKSRILKDIRAEIAKSGESKPIARYRSMIIRISAAAIIAAICTTGFLFYREANPEQSIPEENIVENHNNKPIFLPDGSTVILSCGAKFSASPDFNKKNREVYLEGEAYFDIHHDEVKPFIVHSGKLKTTVLGTAFTIKAIPGDDAITVTVTRGKVKISDEKKTLGMITRGQQMIYYAKKDTAIRNIVNVQPEWKSQDLFLDNVTVAEASKLLEDRFSVKITILDSLVRDNRFTTVFLKTESLEQVLKSICTFNDADYEYDKADAMVTILKK